jgi:hypothetical protein
VSQVWIEQRIRTEREGSVQLTSSVMLGVMVNFTK